MNSEPIQILSEPLGPPQTNCYAVRSGEHLWVIDAGIDPGPLLGVVRETGLQPEAILLTHAHYDHIAGIPEVRKAFPGIPVLVHEAEKEWLETPELNLSAFAGPPVSLAPPDHCFRAGNRMRLGESEWLVIHVPGHSPGSVAFYCEAAKTTISGDALFNGSVGRTDFPGCSIEQLAESIRTGLYTLPGETVVCPGHGPKTTIARERVHNPFVRAED
ncbi:MAG: MBL fold metallo-hydrolase [Planctomycetota bacterium]